MGELAPRQNHRKAKSRLEALLALASGSVAQPVAGIAGGLSGLLTGNAGKAANTVAATQQAMTYAPRDPSSLEAVGRAVEPVTARLQKLRDYLGDKTLAHTGSPALATAGYMVPDTLLTLLGARGAGVKGPKLAQILERSEGPTMGSPVAQIGAIRAYHGSPHDFDRFSMANIGTGEGNQAYGHGLYFAGEKRVADGYRRSLTRVDGKNADNSGNFGDSQSVGVVLQAHKDLLDRLVARRDTDPAFYDPQIAKTRADMAEIDAHGRLYNVELAPDEADLLDWDAPLHEQPEKVRAAIEHTLKSGALDADALREIQASHPDALTGKKLYTILQQSDHINNSAGASEHMRNLGIPGIRYLDGGSRAAGDGSRNYVMFDDSLIKIQGKE